MSEPLGVFVLTMERQGDQVLVTLRSTMDARSAVDGLAATESVRVTRDPQEALAWLRDLVEAWC